MFIINAQNIRDVENLTPEVGCDVNKKERPKRSRGAAVKITVIFSDSQSDCSKNMLPSNMRYIAASLTNQIADILCIDDNDRYLLLSEILGAPWLWSFLEISLLSEFREFHNCNRHICIQQCICFLSRLFVNFLSLDMPKRGQQQEKHIRKYSQSGHRIAVHDQPCNSQKGERDTS